MISLTYSQKHYNSAKHRFFKPVVINFFEREFPRMFGPVMREKLADELIKLFNALAPEASRLKPGQLLWNALDKTTRGDSPNRKFVPVVLSMVTEQDVDQLAKGVSVPTVAQNTVARIIREAYLQGGILSSRDIGLLTLKRPGNISDIRKQYEEQNDCTLPHTGALHDMGSCITHKTSIIRKVIIEKKDPASVARECNHSQQAVDRYLKDYHRVRTLYQKNTDIDFIHIVTGIAKHVVKQYVAIIKCQNSS